MSSTPQSENTVIELVQKIQEVIIQSNVLIGNYVQSNDPRLSDSRNPLSHNSSHFLNGSDPITPQSIGAQPSGDYVYNPVTFDKLSNDSNETLNVVKRLSKAWINFNGTGTVSIRSSYNISSIIDHGTGDYTINFIQPFLNTNYCFVTWARDFNNDIYVTNGLGARLGTSKTSSSVRLIFNYLLNGLNYDSSECNIIFFGD